MKLLAPLRSWLHSVRHRSNVERDMDDELRFHIDSLASDLIRSGLPPAEATRRAHAEFGAIEARKDECREALGLRLLDEFRADGRYAWRQCRRSPGFAVAAVLSLALGIGANTAIFNLLNAVLLQSLPVQRPDQLVMFATADAGKDPSYKFSFHAFQTFREHLHETAAMAATAPLRINVDVDGHIQPTATGQMVSGNYYGLLGVPAALGRTLLPEDDMPSTASPVTVLGFGYWQRQFGGDPRVIGKVVRLNGQPFRVVGVSAPEFFGTHVGEITDMSVALSMQPIVNADFGGSLIAGQGADDFWLELIGRLQPSVSATVAQAEANGVFQQQILPAMLRGFARKALIIGHPRLELQSGSRGLSDLRRRFSRPLMVLMAVVALVLLIACGNVANLLMARAASRGREMAVRVSIGAGRARLIRQLLTESVLLALAGGALGLLLAVWVRQTLANLLVADSRAIGPATDARVLGFTLGVSLLTGLVFGIAPAFATSQLHAFAALKDCGHRLPAAGRRFGLRSWLIVAQVAMSAVLLVVAGLFVRTFVNLRHLDLGFEQQHVLSVRLEPRGSNQKRQNGVRLMESYGELLDRLAHVPGVRSVSLSGATPLSTEEPSLTPGVTIPGYVPQPDEDMHIRLLQIYPEYFATMRVPLLAGRDLEPADNDSRTPFVGGTTGQQLPVSKTLVAVINETMARRFFGTTRAAIGRHFELQGSHIPFEIVGVAGNVRDRAVREDARPLAYATYAQAPTGRGQMTLLVRTSGNTQPIVTTINQLARTIDPAMPLLDVQTLADRVAAATRQEQLVALLSTLFGGLALVLAAVGLYGVMAYTVVRRRAEFGVRLALGASRGGLKRLVLGESLTLVAIGLAIGFAAASGAAETLSHLLFGLRPLDPVAFLATATIMGIVATVAAYLPARQAALVDPIVALRNE